MNGHPELAKFWYGDIRDDTAVAGFIAGIALDAKNSGGLLNWALYENGKTVMPDSDFGKEIGRDLSGNDILRAAIAAYGKNMEEGETRDIYCSVNLQQSDELENIPSRNGILGYGRIKLAIEITKNKNSINFYGLAGDVYNFEEHDLNDSLDVLENNRNLANLKSAGIDFINNIAVGYQQFGVLREFIWLAKLDGTIEES